jgi:hypothetical protein
LVGGDVDERGRQSVGHAGELQDVDRNERRGERFEDQAELLFRERAVDLVREHADDSESGNRGVDPRLRRVDDESRAQGNAALATARARERPVVGGGATGVEADANVPRQRFGRV